MNFEFLKKLAGLENIYENCNNAEKLAKTMPTQSMFTSRKSAEALAKFIYLSAHREELYGLDFAEILSDPTVCRFINDKKVLDAFHYIRKNGNKAVHSDSQESTKDAISVLRRLHYVFGETAVRLKLIKKYPKFNDEVRSYPDAVFISDGDSTEKAVEMFHGILKEYGDQLEDIFYYDNRINRLQLEFQEYCAPIHLITSTVDLVETIEFKSKPVSAFTVPKIQEHFAFMGMQAIKYAAAEHADNYRQIKCSAELSIYGEDGYTTTDLEKCIRGILYDLQDAEGFRIAFGYHGPSMAVGLNDDVREDFSSVISKLGNIESFTYISYENFYDSGECCVHKFENGSWVDLKSQASESILDRDFGEEWYGNNVSLYVDFDFEKYAEILDKLHGIVRKYLPAELFKECEAAWDEEENRPGVLCDGIYWNPDRLRIVQNFLDEINKTIEPIKKECVCGCEGNWYMTSVPLAFATWAWTDEGFKISGTEL